MSSTQIQSSLPPELHSFKYLTPGQVEELTGIRKQSLANQRHRGVGTPYSKAHGIRYALQDVLAYMQGRRVDPARSR